ncbi:hypothetical protein Taro_055423 [Colocasia esculenta]|uniref:Secreted protein n=1 Tax=Colocasia esculenta TaxID=4460 RepID=A0A843XTE1_COLES|nr:hypothetical protein [Colocasia esculenta]
MGPQLGPAAVVVVISFSDSLASLYWGGCRQESAAGVHSTAVFSNPFLGAVRGGTGVCSSLTSWRVRGVCRGVCFRIVFDSAGSAGVVFGPTLVEVVAFLCSATL